MAGGCRNCGGWLDLGKWGLCRRCGEWSPQETGTVGEAVRDDDFVDAVDVEAVAIERIVTGGIWDEAWGGGFVPTSITLLGGAPGAGKSTFLLQLSVRLAEITKRPTYYISAEQDKGELMLTLRRLQLPLERGQLRLLKKFGAGGSIDETTLDKTPPGMIILDSVSALCGNDKHTQIAVAKRYKQYAVKYRAPTFLIAHMTKEADFAGLMALQHEVDTLATLFPEDDGLRHLKLWKHRFGPTHNEFKLLMTELGLVAPPPEPEKKSKKQKKLLGVASTHEEPIDMPVVPAVINEVRTHAAPPDEIEVEGQKLVRRVKSKDSALSKASKGVSSVLKDELKASMKEAASAKDDRAAAIEGEALKRKRPAMPKVKPKKAGRDSDARAK